MLVSLYVLFWPDPAGGGGGLPGADKLVHATLFAALAFTAQFALGRSWRVLLAVACYAPASELVQAVLLPRRSGDLLDVVADLVGVAVGTWLVGRRRGR